MKPVDNVERLIIELSAAPTAALDERILDDSFTALEESLRIQQAVETGGRRRILAVRIAKLAVAAVIIAATIVGVERLRDGREPWEERVTAPAARQEQVVAERQRIMDMFVGGDVAGLVAMLSEGQFESKVLAGLCLGEIGDERALAELQRLYLLAEANPPEGYVSNPFAAPIAKILTRIEAERLRPEP